MLFLTTGMAPAATIIASGGVAGRTFMQGITYPPPLTALTEATATVQVGTLTGAFWNPDAWLPFAVTDPTPITLGSSGDMLGKWQGSVSDTTGPGNAPFAGKVVWFRIGTGFGDFLVSNGQFFPGPSGTLSIDSRSLTQILPMRIVPAWIEDDRIIYAPEPSVALLGGFGGLLALRRRRGERS